MHIYYTEPRVACRLLSPVPPRTRVRKVPPSMYIGYVEGNLEFLLQIFS